MKRERGGGGRQKRTDRQTDGQTVRQTDRQTDRQADRQTDRQRGERGGGESKNTRMLIHVYKQQAVPRRATVTR